MGDAGDGGGGGGGRRKWWIIAVVGIIGIGVREVSKRYGWEKEEAMKVLETLSDRLGVWAMPAYVGVHTLTLALCLPSAVFFEAASSLIFGFFPAVLCVFSAKVLAASLSFWIGRFYFHSPLLLLLLLLLLFFEFYDQIFICNIETPDLLYMFRG